MRIIIVSFLIISFLACGGPKSSRNNDQPVFEKIDALAAKAATELSEAYANQKIKVVIFPLVNPDKEFTNLGYQLASNIKHHLVLLKKLEILERIQLSTLLKELELNSSDLFSQSGLGKIGNFSGADAVVLGEIIPQLDGSTFRIHSRLIKISNTEVLASSSLNLQGKPYLTSYLTPHDINEKNTTVEGPYTLTLVQAKILKKMDFFSKPDTYGEIRIKDQRLVIPRIKNSKNPVWNLKYDLVIDKKVPVIFTFKDKDLGKDDIISEFNLGPGLSTSALAADGTLLLKNTRMELTLKLEKK